MNENSDTTKKEGKMKKNLSIKEAADLMGKSEQFVRIGLQRELLPFGKAVRMSNRFTYFIVPNKFYEYIGRTDLIENK